jgi:hypothetical protein
MTLNNSKDAVNAVRYAVNARGVWVKFCAENEITRDQIADTAREIATLAYPSDEPVQTLKSEDGTKVRTRFGNAVQAAAKGMRDALGKAESDGTPTAQALLTKAGFAATLEEVTAAWKSAQPSIVKAA